MEWGTLINYTGNEFFSLKNKDNNLYIYSYTDNQLMFKFSSTTALVCHTHPNGKISSPSPSDAATLTRIYNGYQGIIFANVIFASDGSEYAVYVNDRTAFINFCNSNSNSDFFTITNDNNFVSGSLFDTDYRTVYNNLQNQGYSDDVCNSYALSYVLDKYNTGMKISERDNNNNAFKEQNTEEDISKTFFKTTTTYTPTKCD